MRTRRPKAIPSEVVPADKDATAAGEKLKAEMDDLLDEIDQVLEDNAEEFVRVTTYCRICRALPTWNRPACLPSER